MCLTPFNAPTNYNGDRLCRSIASKGPGHIFRYIPKTNNVITSVKFMEEFYGPQKNTNIATYHIYLELKRPIVPP